MLGSAICCWYWCIWLLFSYDLLNTRTMGGISQLNPYATPFVPASRTVFVESLKEGKASEKQVGESVQNETADKPAGYQLQDALSSDDCVQRLEKLNITAESSSKGDVVGSISDSSQYEESDMDDPLLVVEYVSSMFRDISTDFIVEALKAHDFDMNLTIIMLYDLLLLQCEGDDYGYPPEAPESSSSCCSHLEPAWQKAEATATSDANCSSQTKPSV